MRALLAMAAAAVAALAFRALWWEPRRLRVDRRSVRLPRWPAALHGLRVAVVSDLHTGAPHVGGRRVARVAARVQAERPDLVVLLGDFVDASVGGASSVSPEAVAARLAPLRAPLGVLAVLGNHDWERGGRRVAAALDRVGIRVLENDAVELAVRGRRLWVAGLGDATSRPVDLSLFDRIPAADPVLALSHHPDVFPTIPERVALTLSGHTHGGQVDLPVVREAVTPSEYGARYAAGHVEENGRHLFVTRGIGTSRLPVRFRSPPEIAVLELRAG